MLNFTYKITIFLLFGTLIGSVNHALGQERTWIDDTGKNRIEAEFLGVEKSVRLRKKNGVIITVPYSRLSPADIAFLERMEASGKATIAKRQPVSEDANKNANSLPNSSPDAVANKVQSNSNTSSNPVRPKSQAKSQPQANLTLPPANNSPRTPSKTVAATQDVDEAELAIVRLQLQDLEKEWPANANEALLKEVASYMDISDKQIRGRALALLGKNDPNNSFDVILGRLDDASFEVRWQASDILESLGDRRAIDPLIERFNGEDCSKIASVLQTFGSDIEEKIIPFLNDPSVDVRLSACDLLGTIGSTQSVASLEELRENATELAVRMQAQSALREIAARN